MTGAEVRTHLERLGVTVAAAAEMTGRSRRSVEGWLYRSEWHAHDAEAFVRELCDVLGARVEQVRDSIRGPG